MARLIPKITIDEIGVKSERDTAKYLVDLLPDDCIIYHSYPLLRADGKHHGNTTISEGEIDFIIILPTHGMLILEVKGGEIGYDEDTRRWHRGDGKPIQDPFEQARRNMHYLIDEIIKLTGYKGSNSLPFTYGYAVVFTDCEYKGSTPPGADPAITFSARDLQHLDRCIKTALNHWTRKNDLRPRPIPAEDLNCITKAISPRFDLLPVLSRKIEEQEEKLFKLTKEQLNLLAFLGQRERACIEGVAGSGKTMLAQAQAEKFADAGKSTLLVCYNKTLAKWINDSISEKYKDLITVKHFHGLCADWVRKAGMSFSPPDTGIEQFWCEEAADRLMDAIDLVPEKFDAVIVDEGQDFYPNWWMPLEMINSAGDEGVMYVFYDPRQNLFVKQRLSLPELGEPFQLPTNCRNTRSIADKCSEILDIDIPTRNEAPRGEEPILLTLELDDDIMRRVERFVGDWIKDGKLKPSQVAILSSNIRQKSLLKDTTKVRGVLITDNADDWRNDKGILFSSIKSFKGLEADAIIVIDVPEETDSQLFTDADYYVACSRAKHLLVVIYKK